MSGESFGYHTWKEDAIGTPQVEGRDAAKHATLHWMDPHNKELSNPKYQ